MIEEGAKQALAVLGIACIGYVGENVLVKLGNKYMVLAWDVVMIMSGGWLTFDFFVKAVRKLQRIFELMWF